jgi:transcriptional regulator with PAS, ATPase and Fis domain
VNIDNLLLLDKDDKALFIGERLFHLMLPNQYGECFCFPSGSLSAGDIIIALIRDPSLLESTEVKEVFPDLYDEPIGCPAIFMANYGIPGIAPIIKNNFSAEDFSETGLSGESCLLKTVFLANNIKVSYLSASHRIKIRFREENALSREDAAAFFLAADKSGIKYFHSLKTGEDLSNITDVIRGKSFEGYINPHIYESDIPIKGIVSESLSRALEDPELEEDSAQAFIEKNEVYILKFLSMTPDYKAYSIEARDDIMESFKKFSDDYHNIRHIENSVDPAGYSAYTFGLRGSDPALKNLRYLLSKAAVTNTTILITGESGTGKTRLAREIHVCSRRSDKAFVSVNCAAIPYSLLESELFGYEEGAFTGARRGGKPGYFEMADGGTLFLDEISEIPLALQGKLLEAIQSRTFFRVGGLKKRLANVRIIAATNCDLEKLVEEKRFREDLFYRINVFPVEIPPLRNRLSSLFDIITDILPSICERLEIEPIFLSERALRKLRGYKWPGNIRELENVLEKAAILSDGSVIEERDIDLPPSDKGYDDTGERSKLTDKNTDLSLDDKDLSDLLGEYERQVLIKTLILTGGSKKEAAGILGIGKTTLFSKIKKYGIVETEYMEEIDS